MPKESADARSAIKNPNEELLKISDRDTADDLWARALWLSISDTDPTSDEITSLFQAALSRANHKAPIYVSFGDVASWANFWTNGGGGTLETMQTALGNELASRAKKIGKGQAQPDKHLDPKLAEEIYKNSLINGGEPILSRLGRAEKSAADKSIIFYLAAVSDDPTNKPAWFRLAFLSKGERRAAAIAESIRLDPDNALPYYLRAIAEFERSDLVAARNSIQTGNQRPIFTAYELPLPETVRLRYPDHESLRELGVVGRPIPYSAFAYFVKLFQSQPFRHEALNYHVAKIARKFSEEAERLQKLGKLREAVTWWEAEHEIGLHLMRLEPRDSLVCLRAWAFAANACTELKRAYQMLDDKEKLQRIKASQAQLKRWIDEYGAIRFPHGRKKDDDNAIMREAAQGTRDFLKEDGRILESTLQHAGLIDTSSGKAK